MSISTGASFTTQLLNRDLEELQDALPGSTGRKRAALVGKIAEAEAAVKASIRRDWSRAIRA